MNDVSESAPHAHLTRREMECLAQAANGLSAKEIAIRLDIAPRTVERHLDQVRIKLNARNRVHMVSQAIRAGVLDAHSPRHSGQSVPNGPAPADAPRVRPTITWAVLR
ncbi:MAG: helix-turn-helix domain-containing protein [Glycocaulis sp.]